MWGQPPSPALSEVEEPGLSLSKAAVRPGKARLLAAALLSLSMVSIPVIARAQKAANASFTEDLPAGPMQAKATTSCLECHEARIIVQQRLSKAAWTREVDKMIKWGAVVDPADRDSLIDYFTSNFIPDRLPYQAPRTAADSAQKAPVGKNKSE